MKLSYIIPLYNSRRFIDNAIKSCYEQNLSIPWEVVCCDDCSSDHTFEYVCNTWGSKPQVRIYRNSENKGQTHTRRTCFDVATGNWFFTLDHDNVLPSGLVERLMRHAFATDRDAVSPKELHFYKFGSFSRISSWEFDYDLCDFQKMITTTKVPPSGGQYLFSRHLYESVGGYPELDEDAHGDWGFGFRHVAKGFLIAVCPDTWYWHCQAENSMYFNMNQKRWHQQIKETLKRYIYKFDDESQKLIETSPLTGHELINGGMLRRRK